MNEINQVSIILYDADELFSEQIKEAGETLIIQKEDSESWLEKINTAINEAKGKYLYFQSGKDSIDPVVIEKAAAFLEENPVNIVCFPQGENPEKYNAEQDENVTGIYDVRLETQYDIGTFNFLVKKMPDHRFDLLLLPKCACIKYFLDAITVDGRFGYLKEGYQKHQKGELDSFHISTFDEYVKLYEFVLDLLVKRENYSAGASEYLQITAVKCLDKVLADGALIPEDFDREQKGKLNELLAQIMDGVDPYFLVKSRAFIDAHLCCLLSLRKKKIDILADKGRFSMYDGDREILGWTMLKFRVLSIKIEGKLLKINGLFINPAGRMIDFQPYLLLDENRMEIDAINSEHTFLGISSILADNRSCMLEVPYKNEATLQLRAEILGQDYPVQFIYDSQIPVNTVRGVMKLVRSGVKYLFNKKSIQIKPLSPIDRMFELRWDFNDYRRMYPEESKLRNKIKIKKLFRTQKIILYVDGLNTDGFYDFFLEEQKKKDGAKRYYCSREIMQDEGNNLVYGGERHKVLSGVAQAIVATSPRLSEYSAFDEGTWEYFRDMMEYCLLYAHRSGKKEETDDEYVLGLERADGELIF